MEVPIIPVKIDGLFNLLPKGSKLPKFGKATISFGKPLRFSKEESYIAITNKIENAVKNLWNYESTWT